MLGRLRRVRGDERGFTLVELTIVIVLMGIVFAIASSTWFDAIDSRNVDSATNQVAADLRLTHTRATNRLADYTFEVPSDSSSTYQIGPTGGALVTQPLPEGTQIATASTIVFKANGEAEVTSGAPSPIRVELSKDTTNYHEIEFNSVTSRIRVCTASC